MSSPAGGVRRRVLPAAAAVAVLAVVGGSAYAISAVRDHSGGQKPPPLRLTAAGREAAAADLAGSGGPGGVTYRLTGTLPDGPSSAKVYTLADRPLDAGVAGRLATALGLKGTPRQNDQAWVVGGAPGMLQVGKHRGQQWSLSRLSQVRCAVAYPQAPGVASRILPPGAPGDVAPAPATPMPSSVEPGTSVPDAGRRDAKDPVDLLRCRITASVPSPDDARRIARPVFEAAGVPADDAQLSTSTGMTTLTVDPTVDGRPTTGVATRVGVGPRSVVLAEGWLGRPTAGASYPVLSAKEAFEELNKHPPMLGMASSSVTDLSSVPSKIQGLACLPRPPAGRASPTPCPPTVVEVRGARFGYSLQWQGTEPLLVPSWLFDIGRPGEPVVQVAVEPRYLVKEPPGGSGPVTSGPGGMPNTGPAVPPETPVTGQPGSGGTASGGGQPGSAGQPYNGLTRVVKAAVSTDGRTLTLTVDGGPSSGPCHTTYTAWAKTDSTHVFVAVQGQVPQPFAEVRCNTTGTARTVTLRLDGTAVGRSIVDGATGRAVPRVERAVTSR